MRIKDLQVINFRNLGFIRAEFAPGINLFHGANAQGKTNILEAIYLLVTGRSFRTTQEKELIPWLPTEDYEATVIRARVEKRTGEDRCIVTFNQGQKNVLVNGTPIQRLGDLIGRINAVLFTPGDLQMIRGNPGLRRRFLDIELSQVNRPYLVALQRYTLALKQRNALLKQGRNRPGIREEIAPWTEQLVQHGVILTLTRMQMLQEIQSLATLRYKQIATSGENLQVLYEPSPSALSKATSADTAQDILRKALEKNLADDLRHGSTSSGPHRDDFTFLLDNRDTRQFGSQGQQRSVVLALKLAVLDYMETITGERPLLLLDDLMSELDASRRQALLHCLDPNTQVFITGTDCQHVADHRAPDRVFLVEKGQLLQQTW